MSSVKRRPDGKWRARYRDRENNEHARHFATRREGQEWIDRETAALVSGTWVDPRAGRVTLRDFAAQWQRAQVGRASTLTNIDVALRLHLLPALGHRPIESVTRTDMQGFVKALQEKSIGAGHIRNIYDVTRRLFTAAVDDAVISGARMPCRRITLPPPDGDEVVPPTPAKVAELTEQVPARYRALVVLLAGSGLRIGEALGLRVSDIDFLRREIRVRQQRSSTQGTVGPCKTPGSVRTVPVGRVVVDELAAHLAQHGDGGDWPFLTAYGKPLTYSSWIEVWTAAQRVERTLRRSFTCPRCGAGNGQVCRKANGKPANVDHLQRDDLARGVEGIDTHGLRHFYVSCLIAGNASVTKVSKRVGHASASITLKVYAHLWPDDDEHDRSLIDAALDDVLRTARGLTG